ncbi:MAG: ribonuclease E/G, partial [Woeseia sp.]
EELQWDLENLLSVWEAIKKVVVERASPFLIYRESNAVIRALRDYLSSDIGEILIDHEATYNEAKEFVEQVMPQNLKKLKLYTDVVPLFTRYQIESQIESAFAHSVTLPSGGSLVIDHTEALVSIDINSARATKGGDIEATALNTNLEAADEVGRQLRLRDLGGLVVIDFIDMGPAKNQREVENRLRDAVRQDRARVQIGKITRFGLLEMSRQRLRPSLGESNYMTCPRCSGIGNIRSVESLALAILRIIGEEARKERTAKVIAQLPVEVATYLLNEKRNWVQSLESRNDTQVILVANSALETPHYQIRRVRDDQIELPENSGTSYSLADLDEDQDAVLAAVQERKVAESAAVATIAPSTPAPARKPAERQGPGLLAKLLAIFTGGAEEDKRAGRDGTARPDSRRDGRSGQRSRRRSSEPQRGEKRPPRASKSGRKRGGKTASADGARNEMSGTDNDVSSSGAKKAGADGRNDSREDKPRTPGKRRSRGGRRRKKPEGESAAANENQQANGATAPTTSADERPAPERAAKESRPGRKRSSRSRPEPRAESGSDVSEDVKAAPPVSATDEGFRHGKNGAEGEAPATLAEPTPAATPPAGETAPPPRRSSEWSDAAEETADKRARETDSDHRSSGDREPPAPVTERADRQPATPATAKPEPSPERTRPPEPAGTAEPEPAAGDRSAAEPSTAREADPHGNAPQPKKNGGEEAGKPAGRLLPWEPGTSVETERGDRGDTGND